MERSSASERPSEPSFGVPPPSTLRGGLQSGVS
ncbi:MAG: CRISPR-associated protein Cas5 [Planctomycetota bacterium]